MTAFNRDHQQPKTSEPTQFVISEELLKLPESELNNLITSGQMQPTPEDYNQVKEKATDLLMQDQFASALRYTILAKVIASNIFAESDFRQIDVRLQLGSTYMFVNRPLKVIQEMQETVALIDKNYSEESLEFVTKAKGLLIGAYYAEGQYNEGLEVAIDLLNYLEKRCAKTTDLLYAKLHIQKAYESLGDLDSSLRTIQELNYLITGITEDQFNEGLAQTLNDLAKYNILEKKFAEAQALSEYAIKILEKFNTESSKILKTEALIYLGKSLAEQSEFEAAIDRYYDALKLLKELPGDNFDQADQLRHQLVYLFSEKGDLLVVERICRKRLELITKDSEADLIVIADLHFKYLNALYSNNRFVDASAECGKLLLNLKKIIPINFQQLLDLTVAEIEENFSAMMAELGNDQRGKVFHALKIFGEVKYLGLSIGNVLGEEQDSNTEELKIYTLLELITPAKPVSEKVALALRHSNWLINQEQYENCQSKLDETLDLLSTNGNDRALIREIDICRVKLFLAQDKLEEARTLFYKDKTTSRLKVTHHDVPEFIMEAELILKETELYSNINYSDLNFALELVEKSITLLEKHGRSVGFVSLKVITLASKIYNLLGDDERAKIMSNKLKDIQAQLDIDNDWKIGQLFGE